jgi:uncharacterized membrane protein YjdF
VIPALIAPALFWLIRSWFEGMKYVLPLSVITFITISVNFSLAAFYEITELWDELYFGGKRIWSVYDTPRDLQWDLIGAMVGSLATFLVLKLPQFFSTSAHNIPVGSERKREPLPIMIRSKM